MAINDNIPGFQDRVRKWFERDHPPIDYSQQRDIFKPGDSILFQWGDEAANLPLEVGKIEQLTTTTDNTNWPTIDPNHRLVVNPAFYRDIVGTRTYEIDEEALKFPNLFVSPETEALIRRYQLKGESLDHCLERLMRILETLADKLEGYRTGGIPL